MNAKPLLPVVTGDRAADLREVVVEINRRLEQQIRDHADQYLWIHDRYRQSVDVAAATADADGDGDGDSE